MKKLILLMCIPFIGLAQTDYQLDFNASTLDYVEMPNASSLIANSTTFSMSAWVYPQANPAAHSGIMGFRNNLDADFYLLQLQNSTNVEARFRNSAGTNFDIVGSNLLDLNQWQHLAFTYDGSNIYLYKDGVLISSTPANGTITQISQSFKIGALDWSGTGFYMNGSLDEVRLWNATLSPTTISNWMCTEVTAVHPDYNSLAGYWRLNDGVGTTATDLSVNGYNGTLNNNPAWQVTTTCFASTVIQKTYVPDDNFENYLEANGMGDGIALNDSVLTSSIDTAASLDVSNQNIFNLTGIEDFISLIDLDCSFNGFNNLSPDLSSNVLLEKLIIGYNGLINIDVSNNTELKLLECGGQFLDSLDVSNNSELIHLWCGDNNIVHLNGIQNLSNLSNLYCQTNFITELNTSDNLQLDTLVCDENILLTSLDLRNGNNINLFLEAFDNPSLNCIDVDDVSWSSNNWTVVNGNIDAQHYFSNDCSVTAIEETNISEKELLKITDVLGREVLENSNQLLFYIYNDGTAKKKRIIE